MKFEIWVEGYRATSEKGHAYLSGVVEASDFEEACEKHAQAVEWGSLFKKNPPRYWGCRLFDNEEDARKSFG